MRDSEVVHRHAEALLERLKRLIKIHPEVTDAQVISIIEIHMLRSLVDTHGNLNDDE